MKCRDLQFELPLYIDGASSSEMISFIDDHLDTCPVCRQKLTDMREIRSSMRAISRPKITRARLESIRSSVAQRLSPQTISPDFSLLETPRRWLDVWLMPYTVGAVGSIVLSFTFLWLILSPADLPTLAYESNASPTLDQHPLILLSTPDPMAVELSPIQYAHTRLDFSDESPSVNPRGALVALTRSLLRGEMKDEEVVVVADVFGNGLARIAEVVEPSDDRKAIEKLRQALQSDPNFAPFVPAQMDRRSESMRVILKIKSVDVDAGTDEKYY